MGQAKMCQYFFRKENLFGHFLFILFKMHAKTMVSNVFPAVFAKNHYLAVRCSVL